MLLSALFNRTRRHTVFSALVLGSALLAAAPIAHAQANLIFSGGNGTPLTLTFTDPVTYTINTSPLSLSGFAVQNVGNLFNSGSSAPLSSTLTYSINGGGPLTMTYIGSGFGGAGSLSDNDVFFGGTNVIVSVGDIVTLTSGSITGPVNFSGPPPAAGSFTTFLVDGGLSRISTNGVAGAAAAPEPGSLALLGMGTLPLVGIMMHRRRK